MVSPFLETPRNGGLLNLKTSEPIQAPSCTRRFGGRGRSKSSLPRLAIARLCQGWECQVGHEWTLSKDEVILPQVAWHLYPFFQENHKRTKDMHIYIISGKGYQERIGWYWDTFFPTNLNIFNPDFHVGMVHIQRGKFGSCSPIQFTNISQEHRGLEMCGRFPW